jgi:hypothetical protein
VSETGARTYRVTELDRLYTGKPLLVACGPLAFTDDAEIADALDRIAADGPYTRVGLRGTRDSRRWPLVDNPGKAAVLPPCPNPCKDMNEVLASMEHVRPDVPVAFWRCGEYLCCYFDHGVADAFVIHRITDALTAPAAEPGLKLSGKKLTRHPFGRALWGACRSARGPLAAGVVDLFRASASRVRRRASDGREHAGEDSASTDVKAVTADELTFVFVSSPPSYLTELRKYRDANHPGVTATGLIVYWICQSLASSGVDLADQVQFTTDLRRFLPPDWTTHSNFIGVVDVPSPVGATPEEFSTAMKKETGSYASLLKILGLIIVQKVLRFRPGRAVSESPSADRRVTVMVTDATKPPPDSVVHWKDPERAEWACFINPETSNDLALLFSPVPGGRIQVTARFSTHIDKGAIETALKQALSPDVFR